MAGASTSYHESEQNLSRNTRDMHRALVSLQEELEAIDWYRQRADACDDAHLREILLHNMREETEHAAMVLEWLRRNDADVDKHLRTYLFTEARITEVEEADTSGGDSGGGSDQGAPGEAAVRFTVGSLRE